MKCFSTVYYVWYPPYVVTLATNTSCGPWQIFNTSNKDSTPWIKSIRSAKKLNQTQVVEALIRTGLCHCNYQWLFVGKSFHARLDVFLLAAPLQLEGHHMPLNVVLWDLPLNKHAHSSDGCILQSKPFLLFDDGAHTGLILVDDFLHKWINCDAHFRW